MRQVQQQVTQQKLALSQAMRTSLNLLQMDPGEISAKIAAEARRNPFLRIGSGHGSSGRAANTYERFAQSESAAQMLLRQIGLIRLGKVDARLARDLVYCLDRRGFLTDSAGELCRYLSVDEATLQKTIARLHSSVEPTGVFARSLPECFELQLVERNRFDPVIAKLLDHLDLVAARDVDAICALCEVDREDAVEMLDDIRALNPAPLCILETEADPVRGPDLIIRLNAGREITVSLNPEALPDVQVDNPFFSHLRGTERDGAALRYYKDCHGSATALITALEKRANTMLRIGRHIAGVQKRFLITGRPSDRAASTMKGAAQALGLHKSTISRAMAGCLVQSPHGVLPAETFFVRPFNAQSSNRTREQILKRLDLLIRTEDKAKPLSDQSLARLLGRGNIEISRRTVAKYRAALGHPSASGRRMRSGGQMGERPGFDRVF
ncbi:MAG: RNA polymerase sigma-54 factor [Ruegeria sp.]